MELYQLTVFRALARSEHVTQTAQALNVTQSSLTKTLGRLEDELGSLLFDRVGRGIRLNEDGRVFLRRVEEALIELQEGRRELDERRDQRSATVTLAVTTASALPGLLARFQKEQPASRFHVTMVTNRELADSLGRSHVDFGLTAEPLDDKSLVAIPLFSDPIYLAVPPGHWLRGRDSVSIRELADEPFVGLRVGFGGRDAVDAVCRSSGVVLRHVYEGNEPARINSLVRAGLGVAFIPGTARDPDDPSGALRLEEPGFSRELLMYHHGRRHLSSAARAFRDLAVDYYQSLLP